MTDEAIATHGILKFGQAVQTLGLALPFSQISPLSSSAYKRLRNCLVIVKNHKENKIA
jgi:hypothetical protein